MNPMCPKNHQRPWLFLVVVFLFMYKQPCEGFVTSIHRTRSFPAPMMRETMTIHQRYVPASGPRTPFSSTIPLRGSASSKEEQLLDSPSLTGTKGLQRSTNPDHIYESAIQRTVFWVAAAGCFGAALFALAGPQTGEEFFAGYLLEQSLSIDNLLVFLLLFEYFKVPLEYQDRVLNWGIIGAIVMRATMIGAGAVALRQFHGVLLAFAGILIYGSVSTLLGGDDDEDEEDFSQNQIVQFSSNLINSTDKFDGDRFFTVVEGVKKATPLLLCMVAVEISDVVFAVDSIPAVFGVTENPLVVFTSNMFAIMGLRSLYTILSKAASELKYLEPAVAVVLGFIGVKLIAEFFGIDVPTEISLGMVLVLLGSGVGLSIYEKEQVGSINLEE